MSKKPFLIRMDEDERAKLETIRVALAARSEADALRMLVRDWRPERVLILSDAKTGALEEAEYPFGDGPDWTPEQVAAMKARGSAPLTLNRINRTLEGAPEKHKRRNAVATKVLAKIKPAEAEKTSGRARVAGKSSKPPSAPSGGPGVQVPTYVRRDFNPQPKAGKSKGAK